MTIMTINLTSELLKYDIEQTNRRHEQTLTLDYRQDQDVLHSNTSARLDSSATRHEIGSMLDPTGQNMLISGTRPCWQHDA